MPSNVLFLPLLSRVPNGLPLAVSLTGSFTSLHSHSISLLSTSNSSSSEECLDFGSMTKSSIVGCTMHHKMLACICRCT